MCPLFGLRRNSLQSASSRITPFRTGIDGIAWDYMGVNGTAGALMASNWDRAANGLGKRPKLRGQATAAGSDTGENACSSGANVGNSLDFAGAVNLPVRKNTE